MLRFIAYCGQPQRDIDNNYHDDKFEKFATRFVRVASSKYTLFGCVVVYIVYTIAALVTKWRFGKDYDWLIVVLAMISLFSLIIVILNFNYIVVEHILKSFRFWWKMQDSIIFVIFGNILYKHVGIYWFSQQYDQVSNIIPIMEGITICTNIVVYVFLVGNVQALISLSISKYYMYLFSNGVIVTGIILNLGLALEYFLLDHDYQIPVLENSSFFTTDVTISCRTLAIAKKIDLSIFFMLQLYSNVRNQVYGIEITGYVDKIWKDNKQTEKKQDVLLF